MFRKSFGFFGVAALLGGVFAFVALAHDGGDDHGILGVEHLHQGITFTATTNAPAGATGKAEFFASCGGGSNSAVLLVQTSGLTDGTYSVSVTDDTGTNTYALGTFDVASSTNEMDDDQGDDHGDHGWGRDHLGGLHGGLTNIFSAPCAFTNRFNFNSWTNQFCPPQLSNTIFLTVCTNLLNSLTNWIGTCTCTNMQKQGGTNVESQISSFALPLGVNPMSIASVSISDSNDVAMLTGDFTSLTNTVSCEFHADCLIVPGTNAPSCHGHAVVTCTTKNGKTHGIFALTAQGAPAKQKFTLLVDGIVSGIARSDKRGNVKIKNLHQKNLLNVKSVVAIDSNQNVVFSVKF